jgi:hypothetical protein
MEDNIKMDHRETGLGYMALFNLARDRKERRAFVNMVMNFLVP